MQVTAGDVACGATFSWSNCFKNSMERKVTRFDMCYNGDPDSVETADVFACVRAFVRHV